MTPPAELISPDDTSAELAGSAFVHRAGFLHATYSTGDFQGAVRLLNRVAETAEEQGHHPDVRLGYGTITFELHSHDAGGVTKRDVRLALAIDEAATELGASATLGD